MRGVTYPAEVIDRALALAAEGVNDYAIASELGVPRATIQKWRADGRSGCQYRRPAPICFRPLSNLAYSYLLGMYLGDGHLSWHGRTWGLNFTLDSKYPEIVEECAAAMVSCLPKDPSRWARKDGAVRLVSYRRDWPNLFPQHGPGRKHSRKIELVPWQSEITHRYTRSFLRGLIHSDGSRCINRFAVNLSSGRVKRYAYSRYFFTNLSADIRRIFCAHCELLGIRWTQSNSRNISVSHRDSVALMDDFIGPKR